MSCLYATQFVTLGWQQSFIIKCWIHWPTIKFSTFYEVPYYFFSLLTGPHKSVTRPQAIIRPVLTLPLELQICVNESGQHRFRWWLVAYSTPSHYPNPCWVIVNWTPSNKLQWNFKQNMKLFIHENASENIVCEKYMLKSWKKTTCRTTFCFHSKTFSAKMKILLVTKSTSYGKTLGRPMDSRITFGDRSTVFQQRCLNMYEWHYDQIQDKTALSCGNM